MLDKRIVALICELYECVNEARFFKFWSDNQSPNTENLLEEYADVIHFALSVANSLGVHEHEYIETQPADLSKLVIGITNQATVLSMSRSKEHVHSLLNNIIALGYQLGFTEQQVIDAYNAKNKINHERQESGY